MVPKNDIASRNLSSIPRNIFSISRNMLSLGVYSDWLLTAWECTHICNLPVKQSFFTSLSINLSFSKVEKGLKLMFFKFRILACIPSSVVSSLASTPA